jgi:L-arabinose reductase
MISNDVPLSATWAAMEKLVETSKARSIGVSNFYERHFEEILPT